MDISVLPQLRRNKSSGGFLSSTVNSDPLCFVFGPFTSDNVDEVGDIVTRQGTLSAVRRWDRIRNIRFMHQPNPVGIATKLSTLDGVGWNEMEAKIVDPSTVNLARNGVLRGYSIGARVLDWEPIGGDEDREDYLFYFGPMRILDYDLVEVSVVDNPANRDAMWSSTKGIVFSDGCLNYTRLTDSDVASAVPFFGRDKAIMLSDEVAIVDYLAKYKTQGIVASQWSDFAGQSRVYSIPQTIKIGGKMKIEDVETVEVTGDSGPDIAEARPTTLVEIEKVVSGSDQVYEYVQPKETNVDGMNTRLDEMLATVTGMDAKVAAINASLTSSLMAIVASVQQHTTDAERLQKLIGDYVSSDKETSKLLEAQASEVKRLGVQVDEVKQLVVDLGKPISRADIAPPTNQVNRSTGKLSIL